MGRAAWSPPAQKGTVPEDEKKRYSSNSTQIDLDVRFVFAGLAGDCELGREPLRTLMGWHRTRYCPFFPTIRYEATSAVLVGSAFSLTRSLVNSEAKRELLRRACQAAPR
jgi:hypothetical protein